MRLTYTDISTNTEKFWSTKRTLCGVEVSWGRVGTPGTTQVHRRYPVARRTLAKIRQGYRP